MAATLNLADEIIIGTPSRAAAYPRCFVGLTILDEDWGAGTATTHNVGVIPREVEIERNDSRTADTARVVLDLRDFPMDPRTVRSCLVRVLMGDVATPAALPSDEQRVFIGYLDAPESNRGEDGSTVTLECRDYTSLFLDHQWQDGLIDVSKPLSDVVAAIVGTVSASAISTVYSAGAASAVLADAIGRPKFAPQKDDNAWTVLTDLCGRLGLIPVFALDVLMILSPEDFGADPVTYATTGRTVKQAAEYQYGVDLDRLQVRRSFKEARQKQIEVRCWDPVARKATTARYPTSAIVTSKKVASDGKVSTDVAPLLPWYVTGTYPAADLAALAQSIWRQAAREEIELTIQTRRIAPALGNGARINVTVAPTLTTDIAGLTPPQAVAKLTSGPRALAADVAEAFVAGFSTAQNLSSDYYLRSAKHKWSREDGFTSEIVLVNYLMGPA